MESASKYGLETVMIISAPSYYYHTMLGIGSVDCVAAVSAAAMMMVADE